MAGKYVALLDHDDLWMPGKLAAQVEFMNSHPQCAACSVPRGLCRRALERLTRISDDGRTRCALDQGPGRSSVGVRITKVNYFKGAVREARFTKRALTPAEFLKVPPQK